MALNNWAKWNDNLTAETGADWVQYDGGSITYAPVAKYSSNGIQGSGAGVGAGTAAVGLPLSSAISRRAFAFSVVHKTATVIGTNQQLFSIVFAPNTPSGLSGDVFLFDLNGGVLRCIGRSFQWNISYSGLDTYWTGAGVELEFGITVDLDNPVQADRIQVRVNGNKLTTAGPANVTNYSGTYTSDYELYVNGKGRVDKSVDLSNSTAGVSDNPVLWDTAVTDFSYMANENPVGPTPTPSPTLCASAFSAGVVGTPFSQTIGICGGTSPFCASVCFGVTWMTANVVGSNLVLGGTPDSAGNTLTKVQVLDAALCAAALCAVITVTTPPYVPQPRTTLVGNATTRAHGGWTATDYLVDPDGNRMATESGALCAAAAAATIKVGAFCTTLATSAGAGLVGSAFKQALGVVNTVGGQLSAVNTRFVGISGTLCASVGLTQPYVDAYGSFGLSGAGGAPQTMTATPTIAAPSTTNHWKILVLVGESNTAPITLQSEGLVPGSLLHLTGDGRATLGDGDILVLMYSPVAAKWIEIARSLDKVGTDFYIGAQSRGALGTGNTVGDQLDVINERFAGNTFDFVAGCAGIDLGLVNDFGVLRIGGSGAPVTPSVVPLIATPSAYNYGKTLTLIGRYPANTVTLRDESALPGSNLLLEHQQDITLASGDVLVLVYDNTLSKWVEVTRSYNTQTPATDGDLKFLQAWASDEAYDASPAAGMMFSTKFNAAGSLAGMGGISVAKANATDGNTDSVLKLHTRKDGGAPAAQAELDQDGNLAICGAVLAVHKAADGTAAVTDGTYTLGLGGTQDGTITVKDGIITAIQQVIA